MTEDSALLQKNQNFKTDKFKCHSFEEYLAFKRVSIKSELQIISQDKSTVKSKILKEESLPHNQSQTTLPKFSAVISHFSF